MKKITSILLTALMLAAMLTVFVVPASAEEEKTADDYIAAGEGLDEEGWYEDAADAFLKAANLYEDAGDPDSAAVAYRYVGQVFCKVAIQYQNARLAVPAADAYMKACEYLEKGGDFITAGTYFFAAADKYARAGNLSSTVVAYVRAAVCYEKANDLPSAKSAFANAARVAQDKANELQNGSTGSVLSEGSLTIIVGVAAAAVFGLGGFLLGRKKKNPAPADGTDE